MKKYFYSAIYCIAALSLVSCQTSYVAQFYQVAQTQSCTNSMAKYDQKHNAYVYEDDNVKIVYDFWAEGGVSDCTIDNKTNEILYIDLDKTFLVKNNVSYVYYRPVINQAATVFTATDRCLPIAPKSYNVLKGQAFGFVRYKDCDFNIKPAKGAPVTASFSESTSPAVFRSILGYRIGEKDSERFVNNEFYVSSVTNYRYDDLLEDKENTVTNCENVNGNKDTYTKKYQQYTFTPKTGFYVVYKEGVTE